MKIDGYTRLAAVVANPIKHSISPFIHNSAFEATNTNGVYLAWEVDAAELAETVANIRRYQMYGINLSMPYKEQVIPYLDRLSEEACLIGAVNTVVNREGTLIGYNTDGKGFFKSLPSFKISKKKTGFVRSRRCSQGNFGTGNLGWSKSDFCLCSFFIHGKNKTLLRKNTECDWI